jgi:hypothetical protein
MNFRAFQLSDGSAGGRARCGGFAGCDAVAHCAGINRETGQQNL